MFDVVVTDEGILLKPKKSIWDMVGSGSEFATVEEMNELLDKMRHESARWHIGYCVVSDAMQRKRYKCNMILLHHD